MALASEACSGQGTLVYVLATCFPLFTCGRNVRSTMFLTKVPVKKKPVKSNIMELMSRLLKLMKLNKHIVLPISLVFW